MGKTINSSIMVADCSKPADFLNPYNLITSLHNKYVRVINWKEKKSGAHEEQSGCTPMHIKN